MVTPIIGDINGGTETPPCAKEKIQDEDDKDNEEDEEASNDTSRFSDYNSASSSTVKLALLNRDQQVEVKVDPVTLKLMGYLNEDVD